MLILDDKTSSEYSIKKPPNTTTFCLMYRNSEFIPASCSLPPPFTCHLLFLSSRLRDRNSRGTPIPPGTSGCCPHGRCSGPWLSAGREAGSLAPSLSRHRVSCHSPASRAREGLLQNYYFRGFADLGSHPCNKSYTGGFLSSMRKLGCLILYF